MNVGKTILLISLVIPGLLMAGTSLYSFNVDYEALLRTERYLDRLVKDGNTNNRQNNDSNDRQNNDRQLELAYHRSLSHRMNAFSNGTWGFIGAAIAAIGIHGIATTKEDNIIDQRKTTK